MAMAIRLPRKVTPDFSYRAIREARANLKRVQARHEEVRTVAEAVKKFTDDHLLTVSVEEKTNQSNNGSGTSRS